MHNPRPIPVLTGQNAERFEQIRLEAERPDAPRYNLSKAKATYSAIMARLRKKVR